jgi:hypothetical protein
MGMGRPDPARMIANGLNPHTMRNGRDPAEEPTDACRSVFGCSA